MCSLDQREADNQELLDKKSKSLEKSLKRWAKKHLKLLPGESVSIEVKFTIHKITVIAPKKGKEKS